MRRGNRDFCAPCVGYRGDSHGTLQHIATTRGAAFPVRTLEIATMKLFPNLVSTSRATVDHHYASIILAIDLLIALAAIVGVVAMAALL